MKKYDVVVIGGGLAGLTLAQRVAEKGSSVLVLEKKDVIGKRPIRCGEAFGPASDWPEEIPFDHSWVETEIKTVKVVAPGGDLYNLVRHGLGWVINREIMEKWLAKRAEEAGAEVMLNASAVGVVFEHGKWVVTYRKDGSRHEVQGTIAVGADGVDSRAGQWMGIYKNKQRNLICATAQVHIPLPEYDRDALYFFAGPKFVRNGYAWIFPGVNGVNNIGLGTISKSKEQGSLNEQLRSFLKTQNIQCPGDIRFLYSGIPVGGIEKNCTGRQCLIVGDAAGMAYPLSGGGIINALKAALMAGDEILAFFSGNKNALPRYEKRFKRSFRMFFIKEAVARKIMFSCTDDEIDFLFRSTRSHLPKDVCKTSEAQSVMALLKAGIPFAVKKIFRHLFFMVLLMFSIQQAGAVPTQADITELQAALKMGESQRYDSAFCAFNTFIARNPAEPLGLILKMNVLGLKMLDYENYTWTEQFRDTLKIVMDRTDSILTIRPDCPWTLYSKGMAMATLSVHKVKMDEYWSGTRLGFKALDVLEKALAVDSSFSDCELYFGLYDYAIGEMRHKLKWLMFWKKPGNKKKGIRKLEYCRKHSVFSRTAAAQLLLGVYAKEKMTAACVHQYKDILSEYPENRPARWTMANYYYEEKQWNKAAPVFQELIPLQESIPEMAKWQRAQSRYLLADCYFHMDQVSDSEQLCRKALALTENGDEKGRAVRKDINLLLEKIKNEK